MKKWNVYARVIGSRYLGEVEAETEDEANEKAEELLDNSSVSLCHQCSKELEDPELEICGVEPAPDDPF